MLASCMQLRTGGRAVCGMLGDATSRLVSDLRKCWPETAKTRPTTLWALSDPQNTYCIQAFFTFSTSYDIRRHYGLIEFHPHRLRNWEFIDGARWSVTVTEAIFTKLCLAGKLFVSSLRVALRLNMQERVCVCIYIYMCVCVCVCVCRCFCWCQEWTV